MSALFAASVLVLALAAHRPALRRTVGVTAVAHARARTGLRRTAEQHRAMTEDERWAIATLLAVGLEAGLPLGFVIDRLARESRAPGADQLRRARTHHARGRPLLDALDAEGLEDVTPVLRSHLDDGAAVSERLLDLSAALRQSRRTQAEEAARRLPVQLLLPMTLCVLPGFLALTVAPVILDALRTLPL